MFYISYACWLAENFQSQKLTYSNVLFGGIAFYTMQQYVLAIPLQDSLNNFLEFCSISFDTMGVNEYRLFSSSPSGLIFESLVQGLFYYW